MQNSIELHLSTQLEAINMLTNELFDRIPDYMYEHAEEALMENLYETMKEHHQHNTDDGLPF